MSILDAYAVLAFFKGELAATEVHALISNGDASLTPLGIAEVLDHLVRVVGVDEEEAGLDLAQLGLAEALPLDTVVCGAAGRLRARYYHRTKCPVSLADCVAAEVARSTREPLATSDPLLLEVCHEEGVQIIILPGSDGSTWALTA